jgi:hypothetical protein
MVRPFLIYQQPLDVGITHHQMRCLTHVL